MRRGRSNQILRVIANNLSGRSIHQIYDIGTVVSQESVLGPMLWNLFYDGVLRENIPECAHLIAYANVRLSVTD